MAGVCGPGIHTANVKQENFKGGEVGSKLTDRFRKQLQAHAYVVVRLLGALITGFG